MKKERITLFYEHDHDELDGYFQEYCLLKDEDYENAKKSFKKFELGLQRHIVWEEEILFPLFEEKTGMHNSGPTFVMREEHRQIKEYLEQINFKVNQNDPKTNSEERLLLEILGSHNQKEENILYPAIDRVVSDIERKAVFQKMNLYK